MDCFVQDYLVLHGVSAVNWSWLRNSLKVCWDQTGIFASCYSHEYGRWSVFGVFRNLQSIAGIKEQIHISIYSHLKNFQSLPWCYGITQFSPSPLLFSSISVQYWCWVVELRVPTDGDNKSVILCDVKRIPMLIGVRDTASRKLFAQVEIFQPAWTCIHVYLYRPLQICIYSHLCIAFVSRGENSLHVLYRLNKQYTTCYLVSFKRSW